MPLLRAEVELLVVLLPRWLRRSAVNYVADF
jgi:hypothetical protein